MIPVAWCNSATVYAYKRLGHDPYHCVDVYAYISLRGYASHCAPLHALDCLRVCCDANLSPAWGAVFKYQTFPGESCPAGVGRSWGFCETRHQILVGTGIRV